MRRRQRERHSDRGRKREKERWDSESEGHRERERDSERKKFRENERGRNDIDREKERQQFRKREKGKRKNSEFAGFFPTNKPQHFSPLCVFWHTKDILKKITQKWTEHIATILSAFTSLTYTNIYNTDHTQELLPVFQTCRAKWRTFNRSRYVYISS